MSDHDHPGVPPPTFEFLVFSLKMQADAALGLIQIPGDEGANPDRARHLIDLLGMLSEKTKGNLTMQEQRLLENSLTELRFRYVQTSQTPKPQGEEAKAQPVENE